MTIDVPSWIPSVEELTKVCRNYLPTDDAVAIRALVAERHRLFNNQWGGVRVMSEEPAPERQEKAGEDLRECPTWYELRKAVESATTKWAREQFEGVDTSLADAEDAAVRELWNRRAPAQPARSTREPLTTDGCPEPDDETLADLLEEIADEFPFDGKRRWIKLAEKRLRAPPPAREKDGEALAACPCGATGGACPSFDNWGDNLVAVSCWSCKRRTAKHHTRTAAAAEWNALFAPRSPSPLSASTPSEDAHETPTVLVSMGLLERLSEELHAAYGQFHGELERVIEQAKLSAPSIAQQAAPSEAGVPTLEDIARATYEEMSDGVAWENASKSDCASELQRAKAVARLLASRGARGTEETRPRRFSEVRGSSLDFAAEQAAEQAAPSRGERREDPSAEYMDAATCLRATAFVMLQAIRSNVPVAPDILDSIMPDIERMDTAREEMGLSALALVERDAALEEAARVCDEEVESANRSIASLPPREHELLEHAECSRLVAKLLAARIRAMKSPPARFNARRASAPASVERDEALEELAPKTFVRVCIIEPTRPFVFEVRGRMTLDMMKDIEHDLCECGGDFSHLGPVDATGATRWLEVTSHGAEYDDTGCKIAPSWLELTLCAMKSPPAPSSASVTPKNDGGAG